MIYQTSLTTMIVLIEEIKAEPPAEDCQTLWYQSLSLGPTVFMCIWAVICDVMCLEQQQLPIYTIFSIFMFIEFIILRCKNSHSWSLGAVLTLSSMGKVDGGGCASVTFLRENHKSYLSEDDTGWKRTTVFQTILQPQSLQLVMSTCSSGNIQWKIEFFINLNCYCLKTVKDIKTPSNTWKVKGLGAH